MQQQTLRRDLAAVSPVIATVFMVAVTIILGAGVVIFGNQFGSNVPQGPSMFSLTTDPSGTQADEWVLRVTAMQPALPIEEFRFHLIGPQTNCNSEGLDGFVPCGLNIVFQHRPPQVEGTLSPGDRLSLYIDGEDVFPTGTWVFEVAHVPSGTISASVQHQFR